MLKKKCLIIFYLVNLTMIVSTCLIEDKFVKSLSIPEKKKLKSLLDFLTVLFITHGPEKELSQLTKYVFNMMKIIS